MQLTDHARSAIDRMMQRATLNKKEMFLIIIDLNYIRFISSAFLVSSVEFSPLSPLQAVS